MMQMTGAALRGQVVSQAATDPLSYTPVKDKSYAFDRPTVICTISMVDPLVRSPIYDSRVLYTSIPCSARTVANVAIRCLTKPRGVSASYVLATLEHVCLVGK